jgi:glycosyltransferase involved in cell wall biosynthesis
VYRGDHPDHLVQALESLERQTLPADEVVIVQDGPIPDPLSNVLQEWRARLPTNQITLYRNEGLGVALQVGLAGCNHELVARMDSDDIAEATRFQKQLEAFQKQPSLSVVGSWIEEFSDDPMKPYASRRVPESAEDIRQFSRMRNPFNHMTVMLRKSHVLAVGGYMHFRGFEDYHLWARLVAAGAELYNIPEALVLVRGGASMLGRRAGLAYGSSEFSFQRELVRRGVTSRMQFIRNVVLRVPSRLLPPRLLGNLYQSFLRQPTLVPGGRRSSDDLNSAPA